MRNRIVCIISVRWTVAILFSSSFLASISAVERPEHMNSPTPMVTLMTTPPRPGNAHCVDQHGNEIKHGVEYVSPDDPCKTCHCQDDSIMCVSVQCSPPACVFEQVPGECCKFTCLDGTDVKFISPNKDADKTNIGIRMIATAITSLLIFALLVFMIHRLRQRHLLITNRRMNVERQNDDDFVAYMTNIDQVDIGFEFPSYEDPPPPYTPRKPSDDGFQSDESPPPYQAGQTDEIGSTNHIPQDSDPEIRNRRNETQGRENINLDVVDLDGGGGIFFGPAVHSARPAVASKLRCDRTRSAIHSRDSVREANNNMAAAKADAERNVLISKSGSSSRRSKYVTVKYNGDQSSSSCLSTDQQVLKCDPRKSCGVISRNNGSILMDYSANRKPAERMEHRNDRQINKEDRLAFLKESKSAKELAYLITNPDAKRNARRGMGMQEMRKCCNEQMTHFNRDDNVSDSTHTELIEHFSQSKIDPRRDLNAASKQIGVTNKVLCAERDSRMIELLEGDRMHNYFYNDAENNNIASIDRKLSHGHSNCDLNKNKSNGFIKRLSDASLSLSGSQNLKMFSSFNVDAETDEEESFRDDVNLQGGKYVNANGLSNDNQLSKRSITKYVDLGIGTSLLRDDNCFDLRGSATPDLVRSCQYADPDNFWKKLGGCDRFPGSEKGCEVESRRIADCTNDEQSFTSRGANKTNDLLTGISSQYFNNYSKDNTFDNQLAERAQLSVRKYDANSDKILINIFNQYGPRIEGRNKNVVYPILETFSRAGASFSNELLGNVNAREFDFPYSTNGNAYPQLPFSGLAGTKCRPSPIIENRNNAVDYTHAPLVDCCIDKWVM